MTTVYLAGPMRGYDLYNFPAFESWAAWLRDGGYSVISPAEMDTEVGFDPTMELDEAGKFLADAFSRDVAAIIEADGIALMPGWRESEGAQFELQVAQKLGREIFTLHDSGLNRYLTNEKYTSDLLPPQAQWVGPVLTNGHRAGHPRFHELVKEIGDLHDKKQRDYGTANDPFANVRGSEQWGIPAWVGAMVRANDKIKRLQNFAQKGELANESATDSFKDLAVYALIALVLYEEVSDDERV